MFRKTGRTYFSFFCIFYILNATATGASSFHTKHKGRNHHHHGDVNGLSGRAAAAEATAKSPRIINGTDALRYELTYQLLLLNNNALYCGAVLISSDWALTAAQCMTRPINTYIIMAGKLDRFAIEAGQQLVGLSQIIVHPAYTSEHHGNDIALLKFNQSITYGQSIYFIRMASSNYKPQGRFLVSGWGLTSRGVPARNLQKVTVPYFDQSRCAEIYNTTLDVKILDTQLCAGDPNIGYTNPCYLDSGGPLVVTNGIKDNWFLVGLVSFRLNCMRQDVPAVYTRVSAFREWIARHTGLPVN